MKSTTDREYLVESQNLNRNDILANAGASDQKLMFASDYQEGALLAKGWLLGIQFDELFRDDLYLHIGENAIRYAARIKETLQKCGYPLFFDSPTNQMFFVIENDRMKALEEKAEYAYMQKYDDSHTVIRFATSWASTEENVEKLCKAIEELK